MGPRRGEIYFVNLGQPRGREQAFERPVLVLSINVLNNLPLVISAIPGTKGSNQPRDYLSDVRVPASVSGLREETVFRCLQLTAIDVRKFPAQPAGRLPDAYLRKVEDAVRFVLGL